MLSWDFSLLGRVTFQALGMWQYVLECSRLAALPARAVLPTRRGTLQGPPWPRHPPALMLLDSCDRDQEEL